MRRPISGLIILAVVAAACGGGSTATSTTAAGTGSTTTAEAPATSQPTTTVASDLVTTTFASGSEGGPIFVISDVHFGEASMVVIWNGGETGSLAGYFLCQRPSYHALEDVVIPEGGFYAISTGGTVFDPPEGAIAATEIAGIGALSATGGEVALYRSSDFANSADIRSYVEWGSAGHGRSQVAQDAGIWEGFIPTTESTTAISAFALPPFTPADWDVLGP